MYDCVVVGLGGAGSSAAFHLAQGGTRVLGLEQFGPVHSHGSSHGMTRIYRPAYSEGPAYVPLVRRAQELWSELQAATGEKILRQTGGLIIGRRTHQMVLGALRSAKEYSLKHAILDAPTVRSRFPQFAVRDDEVAVWDPDAGALFPENCIRAHSAAAVEAGAELHYGERVRRWSASSGSVEIASDSGSYHARSLVLTAGPWTSFLAPDLRLPLSVEQQFVSWFPSADSSLTSPDRMPVFIWDRGAGVDAYGLPDFGDGVKVGLGSGRPITSPGEVDPIPKAEDIEAVRRFVGQSLRGVDPRETLAVSCLYTNAPDHNFVVGPHPRHSNVIVVSACSGHGFKFASVIGEVVVPLTRGQIPSFDLSPFSLSRFGNNSSPRRRTTAGSRQ